jgi:O-antigen ligase
MLVPAVMVLALAGSEQDSEKPTEALRLGLTLSIIPFVAYHLARSDWNRLLDPAYRPVFFLNANGTGFVAAVAFLSFWDYGCTGRRRLWNVTAFAMALACALLVIFTKSRTGLVCLVAPLLAYLALRFRSKSAVAGLVLLLVVLLVPDVGSRLLEIWAPANRPLGTLAGRDQVWYYLIDELIPQNWLIGVGPGHVGGYTQAYVGRSGAHNAWFLYMSEVGLLGTLPLVLCVITTAIAALRTYTGPANHIWHAVFLSGLLHGLAEQGLFSMGNFGGLMFILAVMTLNRRGLAVAGNAQGYKR